MKEFTYKLVVRNLLTNETEKIVETVIARKKSDADYLLKERMKTYGLEIMDILFENETEYIDTKYTSNIVCPYCGHEHDPNEDPNHYFSQDEVDTDCGSCGREFNFSGDVSWTFSSYKNEEDLSYE